MELGRALWPLLWELLVAGPALIVAVVMVVGGARLSGLRRGLALAAGLALAVYELQGLARQVAVAFVDLPIEMHFAWSAGAGGECGGPVGGEGPEGEAGADAGRASVSPASAVGDVCWLQRARGDGGGCAGPRWPGASVPVRGTPSGVVGGVFRGLERASGRGRELDLSDQSWSLERGVGTGAREGAGPGHAGAVRAGLGHVGEQ